MPLTGFQSLKLEEALRRAFYNYNLLEEFVFHQFDQQLTDIVANQVNQKTAARQLVQHFEAAGDIGRLIDAAIKEKPRNEELRAFYDRVWLPLSAPATTREQLSQHLQTLIRPGEEIQDLEVWMQSLMDIGPRVCCIQIAANRGSKRGVMNGTGFLVANDLVVTNYHVMEPVILGERGQETASDSAIGDGFAARTADVQLRFDYKLLSDGRSLGTEIVHQLAGESLAEWLVDQSPYSKVDLLTDPGGQMPSDDELDYVVIRLKRPAAADAVASRDAAPRGCISLAPSPPQPSVDEPLLIIQHPEGKPIKLAFHAVTGLNQNNNRVTYKVNTNRGSSGSPCFNYRWDLVALHHSGDPQFKPVRNQGIPFAAIRQRLQRQGVDL